MSDSQKLSLALVLMEKRAVNQDETQFMALIEKEFGSLSAEDSADVEMMVSEFLAERL